MSSWPYNGEIGTELTPIYWQLKRARILDRSLGLG
jgi:hypothetical protein